jgi:DNA primase
LRARTPIAAVVGRRVRLTRSGKKWKGCCPFHAERSPSFYVYDDGFHCFGCGAHGDVISFVMQSLGLGFIDAVGQLSAEAGLTLPKPTPEAAEAERRRLDLVGVLEAAARQYQRHLALPEGRGARDYLSNRGLTEATMERFGLGWAGERGRLVADMLRQGIEMAQLEEAGLMRRDEASARSFELFSNRVMFPIRDRRGSVISFGGRTLGTGQPKYLNGPETAVFAKCRTLYGFDMARDEVRNGEALVVMEGYTDVIAAALAGFGGTVAPLGTALTQEQMEELWRVSPCPVLCFDGDGAGFRAAARAMDMALPMLPPARLLKFATLPAGEDPDSLLQKHGRAALQTVLDAAQTPSEALYDMVRRSAGETTPEQRAALRSNLIEAANRIADKSLASEYRRALLDRFFADRRTQRSQSYGEHRSKGRSAFGSAPGLRPMPARIMGGTIDHSTASAEWQRILTAILLRHPFLLRDVRHAYATLALDGALLRLRDILLAWPETAETRNIADLQDHLTRSGCRSEIEQILTMGAMPLPKCAMSAAMPAEAEAGWWHFFGFLNVGHLREELASAQMEAQRNLTAETQERLSILRQALMRVEAGEPDGGSDGTLRWDADANDAS